MLNLDTLRELLGKPPAKSELSVELIEETDCGNYKRQLISYLVEPGERIEAYLCIPTVGQAPYPAVYCFHQHGGDRLVGKSELVGLAGAADLAYAKELAEQGFVTLAPDAICFESRASKEDPINYHAQQLFTRLVKGETLLGKVLADMSVGIDLLISLAEVDNTRIGFLGHSYGGRVALFAPVVDRRIKAAVCSCGSTKFRDMLKLKTGIQIDFVIPDFLSYGDLEDILRLVEPASLLILGADQDKWSYGIEQLATDVQSAFKRGTFTYQVFPGKHQFSEPMRHRAYRFLYEQL